MFCLFYPFCLGSCTYSFLRMQLVPQGADINFQFCSFYLDACSFYKCKSYQDCVVVDNAAKCQCPTKCPPSDQPVCASNGISYPSECVMRVKACKIKRELVVVKKGSCGKHMYLLRLQHHEPLKQTGSESV